MAIVWISYPVHIFGTLHELAHIEFNVTWGQLDTLVFQETGKIMVHVWKDHVDRNGRTFA